MTAAAMPTPVGDLDLDGIQGAVETCLHDFLTGKAREAAECGLPEDPPVVLRTFLVGGKRFRPRLCALGWHAAGPQQGTSPPIIRVAAALEVFHAFALIHDDVMDESDLRRGRPTVHRALADRYRRGRSARTAAHVGVSAAILVGDAALIWSEELLHTAGLPPPQLARVAPIVDDMRTEVLHGQYLDLVAASQPRDGGRPPVDGQSAHDVELALKIARYKAAKYTFERPLHVGAAIADASPPVMEALTSYALPVGEAFQLRDDLLGVFGDPADTGKPATDDLREGKHTALLALALQRSNPVQRRVLQTLVGTPELDATGADRVRDILFATGSHDAVEAMIEARYQQALSSLARAPFPPAATSALYEIARAATARTR